MDEVVISPRGTRARVPVSRVAGLVAAGWKRPAKPKTKTTKKAEPVEQEA